MSVKYITNLMTSNNGRDTEELKADWESIRSKVKKIFHVKDPKKC